MLTIPRFVAFMDGHRYQIVSIFFFLSGFCSLLYQTVWLRLAFSHFGVIMPVVSIVISVFMLGLAIGSWAGGKYLGWLQRQFKLSSIAFYGICELAIGCGAFLTPIGYEWFSHQLLSCGEVDSAVYLCLSAIAISVTLFPWTIAMGATLPFAMNFLNGFQTGNRRTFGLLYLTNVIGAFFGIMCALMSIEINGFLGTLQFASVLNFSIFAVCGVWSTSTAEKVLSANAVSTTAETRLNGSSLEPHTNITIATKNNNNILWPIVLFSTGFSSLGMEVVITRAFTPVLGTVVYSFASLLVVYLMSTSFGSLMYKLHTRRDKVLSREGLLIIVAITSILPLVVNDPRLPIGNSFATALLSISPFCVTLGYLTPAIIDDLSQSNPMIASRLYALNVLGGIIGPLFAGYLLLPTIGAAAAMWWLMLPLLILALIANRPLTRPRIAVTAILSVIIYGVSFFVLTPEEGLYYQLKNNVIHRDYAATTISCGEAMKKMLIVNGESITGLCSSTKHMAHIPLSLLTNKPTSALVICLGMGTTYRSLLSWGIATTAVELVPGVKQALPFYFDDAKQILKNSSGKIIIDDGRRFLQRTSKKFDLITIDPPPPVEAAGTSLLYSKEFYNLAKAHLKPHGILHNFCPDRCEKNILYAVTRSIHESFPYVRVIRSYPSGIGFHFICSQKPIPVCTAEKLVEHMPITARNDLVEWSTEKNPIKEVSGFLSGELVLQELLHPNECIAITDDKPYNEYFWLRRFSGKHSLDPRSNCFSRVSHR